LLLRNNGLVKTIKFKDATYIGDPINAVKIFNEKEVDELIFLDIDASKKGKALSYDLLKDIASECFMPLCYGGGIKRLDQIEKITKAGVEKVAINTSAFLSPLLITQTAKEYGSSTIVVSMDVKKNLFGESHVYVNSGSQNTWMKPVEYARKAEELGAGEIMLTSIDRDGTLSGYDLELIHTVSKSVSIPIIACGGASGLNDFRRAVKEGGASAVAAGSFFVFHGKRRAVLISYPSYDEIENIFSNDK